MITTKRGLKKPATTDPYNVEDFNANADKIEEILDSADERFEEIDQDLQQVFQSVSDGKATVAGAITDKGVPTSPTATFQQIADNIEAIETDPSIGTTDATAADVLAPKKVVSQGQLITGTIPVAPTFPNENEAEDTHFYGTDFTSSAKGNNLFMKVPKGYYNGGWLGARVNYLIPSNVKAGIVIVPRLGGGKSLTGTFTSDGTATAAQMLSGVIAYVNGNKITGTIPSKAAQTFIPGTTNQTIASGQYLSGGQIIAGDANFIESNLKSGVNLWGKVGTLVPATNISTTDPVMLNQYSGGYKLDGLTSYFPDGLTFSINKFMFAVQILMNDSVTITSSEDFLINYSALSQPWTKTKNWSKPQGQTGGYLIINPSRAALNFTRNPSGGTQGFVYYRYID